MSFLWHFPAGFPGSALPTTLPCDVRTFLEGSHLRDCSACASEHSGGTARRAALGGRLTERAAAATPGRCTALPQRRPAAADSAQPTGGARGAAYSGSISPRHTGHATDRGERRAPPRRRRAASSSVGSPPTPVASKRRCQRRRAVTTAHAPHQPDDLAHHANVAAADRLHRVVLRLQPDVVGLLEEALDGRLLADQRDHDVAVARLVLAA